MTTALVTGANRGIGLELCRQLRERGDDVIATCRRTSKELARLGARVEENVDVSDDGSVKAFADRMHNTSIDLLIHNAGIFTHESLDPAGVDIDAIRRQFEVNALGPLRLTAALLPRLTRGAKVAILTSRMGSMSDNTSGGYYGYRMSKAAVNAAGVSLARDLAPKRIAVAMLHPGYVRTEMTGNQGNVEPADAARDLLARIDALTIETSGTFVHANGEELPW
jgi:NAD(P)-dependent dehydrogenase (short-subunit alcohol dehydrogenase family)